MPTLRLQAMTLSVSVDELMTEGEQPSRQLCTVPPVQQRLGRISALPSPRRRAVMEVVEPLLAQQGC